MSVPTTPRASSRRKLLTELRRQEILSAAIKLFGRKGFAATCVDDIATAAGIAKGTLYLYFKSKEEMYAASVHLALQQLERIAAERLAAAHGLRERLAVAISVRMEFWNEQLDLYRLLLTLGREPQHRRQTHTLLRSGHDHFLEILQSGEAEVPVPTPNLDNLAWTILDMVRGANERRIDKLTVRTPQEDAASITAFALRQLGLDEAALLP